MQLGKINAFKTEFLWFVKPEDDSEKPVAPASTLYGFASVFKAHQGSFSTQNTLSENGA